MDIFLIFLPGLIGGALTYIWVRAYQEAYRHKTSLRREFISVCFIPWDLSVRKRKNKERVVKLLKERHRLIYSTIHKELKLSSATLNRCLKELENEGAVVEAGRNNEHAVFYRLK